MTTFDYIKDILVDKTGTLSLAEYVPFMINRWLSFINPAVCEYINAFNTKQLLENKELHYKTLLAAFPKMSYCPRIKYIKKVKEEDQELDVRIKHLAHFLEISQREAQEILNWTTEP